MNHALAEDACLFLNLSPARAALGGALDGRGCVWWEGSGRLVKHRVGSREADLCSWLRAGGASRTVGYSPGQE